MAEKEPEGVDVPTWLVVGICFGSFAFLMLLGSLATAAVIWVLKMMIPITLGYNFSLLGGIIFSTIILYESLKRAF